MPMHNDVSYVRIIPIYVSTIIEDKSAAKKYKKELGKLSKGVSCFRFKTIKDINPATLETVLKLAKKSIVLLMPL